MKLVDRPYTRPHRCAALPYVGQTTRTRWVDTGSEMPSSGFDSHIYLSEPAVEAAALLLGLPARGEYKAVRRERDELAARVLLLEEERDELRARLDAIDVIESEGFRARKKTGRPKVGA